MRARHTYATRIYAHIVFEVWTCAAHMPIAHALAYMCALAACSCALYRHARVLPVCTLSNYRARPRRLSPIALDLLCTSQLCERLLPVREKLALSQADSQAGETSGEQATALGE